jgi:hypothetical protein
MPGEALPDLGKRVARHTKGNKEGVKAERPNIRLLARPRFEKLASMGAVAQALFGVALPTGAAEDADRTIHGAVARKQR